MQSNLKIVEDPLDFDANQFAIWELNQTSGSPVSPVSSTSPNSPTSAYLLNQSTPISESSNYEFKPKCSSCEIYFRRMNGLENELQILTNNIYSLFKTAKEEIQRKDKLIQEKDEIIKQLKIEKATKRYSR